MLTWRRTPDALLVAAFPLAALTVTAIAVLDPPLALTPMFYVWPLLTGAYFLQRREILCTYAFTCGSFGAASLTAAVEGPRLIQWLTVIIVGGVVVSSVATMKNSLEQHVGSLRRLSREDPLTGALNRRAFVERLDAELARARRAGDPCTVALIDVDHFKDINDRHGHAVGDEALRRLVRTIDRELRHADVVGRLGGEEFAVLLTDADPEAALTSADRLRAAVARETAAAGTPFTVSVGLATAPDIPFSAEGLLAVADQALYGAKHAGRDTVHMR